MSLEMTHDDVRAALAAEALDALDGDERAQVRAHLQECDECRRELAELREAAGAVAHAAPHRPMEPARSGRLRARLLARAAADRGGAPPAPSAAADADVTMLRPTADSADSDVTLVRPASDSDTTVIAPPPAAADPRVVPIERARERRSGGGFNGGWLAAAASVVLLIASGVYALRLRGEVDRLNGRIAAVDGERGQLAQAVAERDSTIATLAAPDVRVIDLAATGPQAPAGRMFWDPRHSRWTFFASNLPALRPGRDYQLWVITAEGPQAADTFKPDPSGHATVEMRYEVDPAQVRAVAVTEEPEGGLPKPSGTPFIVGAVSE